MNQGKEPVARARMETVSADQAGQRMDNFLLRHFRSVPRSHVYRLLRKGAVRVNRKRVNADYRLVEGDELRLPLVRMDGDSRPAGPSRSLVDLVEASVIHSDERILVIDKPSGVAVHGGSGMSFGVIEALRASRPRESLELVHRLDRDTSGCLIVARRRSALTVLHQLIRDGKLSKSYLALVAGKWPLGTKRIDASLSTDERRHGERHVRVSRDGKASVSVFRPVRFFGRRATLMEVDILTGRTHQIRVHAAHVGHPLLGDDKYGERPLNQQMRSLGLKRIFLHARAIGFDWPDSGTPFHVNAPLPPDLSGVLDTLAGEA